MDKKRALVVDDNALNRELLRTLLSRLGLESTQVRDGASALQELRGRRFDLVLLDLKLPDMPGIEVIREVRRRPENTDLALVVVSGSSTREDEMECRQAGCNGFLAKPFTFEQFVSEVEPLLKAAR